ncbi:hypothetical protein THAOC_11794, partial [Thalassiosira oceanica]
MDGASLPLATLPEAGEADDYDGDDSSSSSSGGGDSA